MRAGLLEFWLVSPSERVVRVELLHPDNAERRRLLEQLVHLPPSCLQPDDGLQQQQAQQRRSGEGEQEEEGEDGLSSAAAALGWEPEADSRLDSRPRGPAAARPPAPPPSRALCRCSSPPRFRPCSPPLPAPSPLLLTTGGAASFSSSLSLPLDRSASVCPLAELRSLYRSLREPAVSFFTTRSGAASQRISRRSLGFPAAVTLQPGLLNPAPVNAAAGRAASSPAASARDRSFPSQLICPSSSQLLRLVQQQQTAEQQTQPEQERQPLPLSLPEALPQPPQPVQRVQRLPLLQMAPAALRASFVFAEREE